ncbi:hypothetical protein [Sedimenticola hydrogenitrophicus]|uniref:hypothetical protein n=1 Tax=Sedimenticola hydrogenitrophicus TaxID=2967975 RepID=UPI0021A61137|nr:hypothetical protein [Sedimenticola hydrogenitrophicus]
MFDLVFCERILGIEAPWCITRAKQDINRQRVDIWIGERERNRWFKPIPGGRAAAGEEQVWQHLGMGGFRTYIHTAISEQSADHDCPWIGRKGLPFTRALTQRILELLGERTAYGVVCGLLNVDLEDVWRLKHSLDGGTVQKPEPAPRAPDIRDTATITTPEPESDIPIAEDPVWHRVISNESEINIRQLGLKLLISRVRSQYVNADSDEVRNMRRRELRKYFVRHQRSLQHELGQLKPFSRARQQMEQM